MTQYLLRERFNDIFNPPIQGGSRAIKKIVIAKILEKLTVLGMKCADIKSVAQGTHEDQKVIKLNIPKGSGKDRIHYQLWFNKDQELVHKVQQNPDMSDSGQRFYGRGRNPKADAPDFD